MTSANAAREWENYPCNLPDLTFAADLEIQRDTLEKYAPRLFSGHDDVEVWKSDGDGAGIGDLRAPSMRLIAR